MAFSTEEQNLFVTKLKYDSGNKIVDHLGDQSGTTNLKYGGMFGYTPRLGFDGATGGKQWLAAQPYVSRNIIPILVEAPLFFKALDSNQGKGYYEALKSLVELHPKSITGLKWGYNVESIETPIGDGTEKFHVPSKVTGTASEPSFTWDEKEGKPIQNFLDIWIRYGISDPRVTQALVTTLPGFASLMKDGNHKVYDATFYTMTMLFIEPDRLNKYVSHAWLVSNMYPNTTGEHEGKRDLSAAGESKEVSVTFTGFSSTDHHVVAFAQKMLESLRTNVFSQMPEIAQGTIVSAVQTEVGSEAVTQAVTAPVTAPPTSA
jgi:hypothetical protein